MQLHTCTPGRTDALTRQTQLTEHQRLLERQRTQRVNATLQRQPKAQKQQQQTFNRETRLQQRIRLWLVSGLTLLLLFTTALILAYRKNQRQQRLIRQLNTGLEQTVQTRTAELLTANDELRRANQAIRETDTALSKPRKPNASALPPICTTTSTVCCPRCAVGWLIFDSSCRTPG